MTTRGEILAAFVTEEFRPSSRRRKRSFACGSRTPSSVSRIPSMSGAAAVGRNLTCWKFFLSWMRLRFLTRAVCCRSSIGRAMGFAEQHHLMGTVGSMRIAAFELGRSLVLLDPFDGPDELRKVIRTAHYQMHASAPGSFDLRYATLRKKNKQLTSFKSPIVEERPPKLTVSFPFVYVVYFVFKLFLSVPIVKSCHPCSARVFMKRLSFMLRQGFPAGSFNLQTFKPSNF